MSVMDAKRNYVVDTATKLFLSRPLSQVTVRDVAQEVKDQLEIVPVAEVSDVLKALGLKPKAGAKKKTPAKTA